MGNCKLNICKITSPYRRKFCIKMSLDTIEGHFYTVCPFVDYRQDSIMARKAGRLRRIMSLDTQ